MTAAHTTLLARGFDASAFSDADAEWLARYWSGVGDYILRGPWRGAVESAQAEPVQRAKPSSSRGERRP